MKNRILIILLLTLFSCEKEEKIQEKDNDKPCMCGIVVSTSSSSQAVDGVIYIYNYVDVRNDCSGNIKEFSIGEAEMEEGAVYCRSDNYEW